ncbi:T9SS C-terminal target domain-containing protein [Maribacter thermophilus]|uniref:T9SS C-terminal target domain-containing protein n=1 Tax=Maribacter thermophilus TaxID=1197874 RepID=UPI0006415BB9|nr:T9SS C-terminal target domain-containing protein [Maribacter thermophilus]
MEKTYFQSFLSKLLVLVIFLGCFIGNSQTIIYAESIAGENNVDNSSLSIDSDLITKAEIRANSGLVAGLGSYSGYIELQFPSTLPAFQTTYTKIETEDGLLTPLLGGNLGGLLSDVVGVVLIGNQEFNVQLKNGSTVVSEEDSGVANPFSTDEIKVVIDKNEQYFIAASPSLPYNRIRLTNRTGGSLLGLGTTKRLGVFDSFYTDATSECVGAEYTSFFGSGLTLDLLGLGGAGVDNPHLAIDDDLGTYSNIGLGVIGVAASIGQTFYLNRPSVAGEVFYLKVGVDPDLVQVGLLSNIQLSAKNGSSADVDNLSLSSLLDLDLLGLLGENGTVDIPYTPSSSIDRISLELSSLLNVSINQGIQVYGVYSAPMLPTIDAGSEDVSVCSDTSTSLIATVQNPSEEELRWYDAPEDGNLLATLTSGDAYVTPNLTETTTYYVAAKNVNCAYESPRVAVTVTVIDTPTADDIDVALRATCNVGELKLVPSSDIAGSFNWYLDSDGTNQITDGMVSSGITYTIESDDTLTINGLTDSNIGYSVYASLVEDTTSCTNEAGNLKEVVVSVTDSSLEVDINLDTALTIDDLISISDGGSLISLEGSASGGANEGDTVTISIDGQQFLGVLDSNLEFSIDVDALGLLEDIDSTVEITLKEGLCATTDLIPISIPELTTDIVDYVFCAADNATVADLELLVDNGVFFDALVGGNLLDVNASLVDGGSYFLGLLNIPVDVLARIQINVDIIEVPMATTNSDFQSFCSDTDPIIGDIQVNETNVVFYDSATGGNILDPDEDLTSGDYYVARTMSSCESERLQITVEVLDGEPASLVGQIENACLDRSYTYNTDEGKTDYVWTVIGGTIIDGGQSTDDFVSVVWTSMEEASVAVSYSDTTACDATKENQLEVEVVRCGEILGEDFCLLVFNVFSPNGDGFNDYFEIQCIENFIDNTVTVYNRNGNKVFEAVNYQNNWDGIANVGGVLNKGDHLPSGTYYYVIHLPELDRDVVGWLQLAR